jgi:hypothetical protein|tara:strand:+ start:1357 stop:1554 length:198 start_codon:yes stop_codon:yes gene_type:complete
MPIFSDEYGKESSLLFLGKHGVKEFEERFDFYYDKYRDISNKRGFFGEIKFVISYDVVWIYVMID